MQINVIFDQSVSQAPAGFQADVLSVARYYEQQFTDNFTFNLHVGYGEFGPNATPIVQNSGAGRSLAHLIPVDYSQIKNALANDAKTADDFTAVATLPASDPNPSPHTEYVSAVQAVALGLVPANTVVDEYVGFSSTESFDYNRVDGISASQVDFVGVVANEISKVMGRLLGANERVSDSQYPANLALDLFHYALIYDPSTQITSLGRYFDRGGYFSFDNGATDLGNFNDYIGDAGDWRDSTRGDAFTDFSFRGERLQVTENDLRVMDVIGYDRRVDVGGDANFAYQLLVSSVVPLAVTTYIDFNGDKDWYQVTLTGGKRYRIDLSGADGPPLGDPIVRVYDANSNLLATDDDSGPGLDSQLWLQATSGGTYFIEAAGLDPSDLGRYTIRVLQDDYSGDTVAPGQVPLNGSTTGEIEIAGDRDWFRIHLIGGTSYRFNLDGGGDPSNPYPGNYGGTLNNPYLRLYNGSSSLLSDNDDDTGVTGFNSQLLFRPSVTGDYYLEASSGSDALGTARGTYTLRAVVDDYAGDTTSTGSIALGGVATGNIELAGDHDWFRLQLTGGTSYTIGQTGFVSHTGSLLDPASQIWSNSRRDVALGLTIPPTLLIADGNQTLDSQLHFTPTNSAFYFLDAAGTSNQTGTYTVSLQITKSASDFDHNGVSDIMFRDDATGYLWFYGMSNGALSNNHFDGGSSTAYAAVGTGDFNGDATADILWRNNATGDTGFFQMGNGYVFSWNPIGGSDTRYAVVGAGDFNADGTSDILFRNNATGDTWFEGISNGAFNGWNQIGGSDTRYAAVGVGDFDGNAAFDILYRNNATGDTWFAAMRNGSFNGWRQIGGSDTRYAVVGVGDFDSNGVSDILYRNATTGDTWIAGMNTFGFQGGHSVGGSDTRYAVAGTGDYNGDGTADILFRNNGTGDVWFEAMSNSAPLLDPATHSPWHQVAASGTSYKVVP